MFQTVLNSPWTNLLLLCLVEVYGDFKFKAYARSDIDGVPLFIQGCVGYAGVI